MPALIGLIPQTVGARAPAGGQRAARADAQHRERGRTGAGRRARRRRRAPARRSPSTRRPSRSAPRAWSRLRRRPSRPRSRDAAPRGTSPSWPGLRTRVARGALAHVAELGPGRDERLPRLRAAVGLRARARARRAASSTAPRAGRRSSPASGSAACWQRRGAAPPAAPAGLHRRPGAGRRLHAGGDHRLAAWAPSASPALELLAGVCVALFFTLWDLSIQEQIPAHAVSRVSAYDFSVSMGLMPLGMAMAGPIADALGPAGRRCSG